MLGHGFATSTIGPQWWAARGLEISLPTTIDGAHYLTRGDIFAMASDVDDDESLLSFLWHVLAWGSGTARRNNTRRIDSCSQNITLLRECFDAAREGECRAAYRALVRPGGAVIPWFGPAFFTKFLYFASNAADPRCLILDARVARALQNIGWTMAPNYPSKSFSYNWYTDTYVSYCSLLTAWAADNATSADILERLLFQQPDWKAEDLH